MRYRLAIYDFNGTLAPDVQIGYSCMAELLKVFAPQSPIPTIESWRAENGNVNFREFYYRHGVPRTVTMDDMRKVWGPHYHSQAISKTPFLNPGAEELLRFCWDHKIPNVIVSSSIDDVTTHLERSGVLHLFELIEVGIPHKQEKLREIASRFGTKKNEAFYLDDTADGVQCAKETGIAAFGFTQGFNLEERIREAKPHHVVHSFHDALSIIKD